MSSGDRTEHQATNEVNQLVGIAERPDAGSPSGTSKVFEVVRDVPVAEVDKILGALAIIDQFVKTSPFTIFSHATNTLIETVQAALADRNSHHAKSGRASLRGVSGSLRKVIQAAQEFRSTNASTIDERSLAFGDGDGQLTITVLVSGERTSLLVWLDRLRNDVIEDWSRTLVDNEAVLKAAVLELRRVAAEVLFGAPALVSREQVGPAGSSPMRITNLDLGPSNILIQNLREARLICEVNRMRGEPPANENNSTTVGSGGEEQEEQPESEASARFPGQSDSGLIDLRLMGLAFLNACATVEDHWSRALGDSYSNDPQARATFTAITAVTIRITRELSESLKSTGIDDRLPGYPTPLSFAKTFLANTSDPQAVATARSLAHLRALESLTSAIASFERPTLQRSSFQGQQTTFWNSGAFTGLAMKFEYMAQATMQMIEHPTAVTGKRYQSQLNLSREGQPPGRNVAFLTQSAVPSHLHYAALHNLSWLTGDYVGAIFHARNFLKSVADVSELDLLVSRSRLASSDMDSIPKIVDQIEQFVAEPGVDTAVVINLAMAANQILTAVSEATETRPGDASASSES